MLSKMLLKYLCEMAAILSRGIELNMDISGTRRRIDPAAPVRVVPLAYFFIDLRFNLNYVLQIMQELCIYLSFYLTT